MLSCGPDAVRLSCVGFPLTTFQANTEPSGDDILSRSADNLRRWMGCTGVSDSHKRTWAVFQRDACPSSVDAAYTVRSGA